MDESFHLEVRPMNRVVSLVDDVYKNISFEKIRMLWRSIEAFNSFDNVDVKLIFFEGLQDDNIVWINKRHSRGILVRGL